MRRVLVRDDHQSSRRHLVAILNSGGYEVTGAYSMGFGANFMHESAANIFAEFAALTAGRLRDLSARQLILLAAS